MSLDDIDCISYCDNSLYVLPPKTELNSSFFIDNENISHHNGKNSLKTNFPQRKISNIVDIPTYKGFSIANGYSVNNKKSNNSNLRSDMINFPEKCHLSRKVHLSAGKSETKSFTSTKPRLKLKIDEHKINAKIHKDCHKNIRRVETFLGDKNYVKQTNSNFTTKNNNKITEKSQADIVDKKHIKEYIENKRRNNIKQTNEDKLTEKQKRDKIEEQLKLLSERIKINDKIPKSQIKIVKERIRKAEENLNNINKTIKNHYKRTADSSSSDSETSCCAVKQKLAKWIPLSNEELETYRLTSKYYMTSAINNNQKTDNILSNIIKISDKIALTKEELSKLSKKENLEKKLAKWNPLSNEDWEKCQLIKKDKVASIGKNKQKPDNLSSYLSQQERNIIAESNSVAGSSYEEFEIKECHFSGLTNGIYNKHDKIGIKKEIAPSILANRARRKLDIDIDNEDMYENDESDNTVSAYNDRVDRLIEENQRRYEKSMEVNEQIMLPIFKSHPKRINNFVKGSVIRHHEIIKTIETDSLTFMRTYLKSKNKRSSTAKTNNSRISNESNKIKHSRTHSYQSMNILDNDSSRIKSIQTTESNSSNSEIEKSLSVENINENFRGLNAFSEVEVTIENSSYSNHVKAQQFNKIPFNSVNIHNSEARLSPDSLEKKFSVELHHYDGIHANMEQLIQSDRFQGIGFSQQETVSLAQILKARQWKDTQESENKQYIQQFINAITNFNNNQLHKPKKYSTSSNSSISLTAERLSSSLQHKKVASTTESEASEIEEEVIDFSNSSESQFENPSDNSSSRRLNNEIKTNTNNIKSKDKDKFISVKRNDKTQTQKNPFKSKEPKVLKSNIIDSIQEISTAKSISGTFSDLSEKLSKEESIAKSIETESLIEKSPHYYSSETSNNSDVEISSTRTMKTDSNFISSEKSLKEISAIDSMKSEIKSKSISVSINKKSNSKLESKSAISIAEDSSTIKSEINTTNYSRDDFESNSDYQKSTSESDVMNRIYLLENEKEKKQMMLEKLQHKLSIVKQRQKEKSLRNHINYLDSQIETLQEELKNPNLSSSSLLLSPVSKPHKPINFKEIKILPTINRKSSTSSSSTLSKDEEGKSLTISMSSSTLTSEVAKDLSFNNKNDFKKSDEVETPRSSKQIQFEDINEEYSASNRDSSDLKTPSEKSHISKEITDGTLKSENFHILDLDKQKEDDLESIVNENEDLKVISARTIHSEISEIPMEGEISDQDIDNDFYEKAEDLDKNKKGLNQDFYSEDFSEVLSQRNSMNLNTNQAEINEISNNVEVFSFESSNQSTESLKSIKSVQSSESIPPVIPLRRRKVFSQNVIDDSSSMEKSSIENSVYTVNKICNDLFNSFLTDIINENELTNKNFQNLSDFIRNGEDDSSAIVNKEVSEIIHDSLVEELKDRQYDFLDKLIPWNNENILPLVDLAIEQLFYAQKNRTGTLSDAFKYCCDNPPSKFLEINSITEKIRIYHTWQVNESLTSSNIQVKEPFIPRIAIFHIILEIMELIYELDDQLEPMPWMKNAFNILKNKKLLLWERPEAPNSIELVTKIVKKQLLVSNILTGSLSFSINKTRQHKWFYKQTNDAVDKLLIDETLQEDFMWQNYDAALETTVFSLVDEINDKILNEIVGSLE